MAGRSEQSLAALLLTQRLVEASVPPLKASEYWSVIDRVADPAALLGSDPAGVARAAGIESDLADRIAKLIDAATALAFELDEAEQSGLRVLASVDEDYPPALVERLGRGAPPLLYVLGEPQLLQSRLLGIVGSRDVGERAAAAAKEAAAQAVNNGLGVVSGGAKGVDRLAMQGALEAGGNAVGVLADSLTRTVRDAEIRRMVGDGRLCLCTPYKPTAGFSVPNAMGRNKLIYALSQATLVIAADLEKGGTWAGAQEAVRQKSSPVLVWCGEGKGPGNDRLVELGAKGIAGTHELFPLPVASPHGQGTPASQLAMDV
jgi:predicted Rossmann fold nucleotide-binding protein DprA/Smf involved in DNA uptake